MTTKRARQYAIYAFLSGRTLQHYGLDGELFTFKGLNDLVHTPITQIVPILFRIRSFSFLRETKLEHP